MRKPKKLAHVFYYKLEFARQAEKLCGLGFSNAELAEFLGVKQRTIYNWQARCPEFAHALAQGHARARARVEQALYCRAIGYTREATQAVLPKGARKPVLVPYTEHVAPDRAAALACGKLSLPGPAARRKRAAQAAAAAMSRVVVLPPDLYDAYASGELSLDAAHEEAAKIKSR